MRPCPHDLFREKKRQGERKWTNDNKLKKKKKKEKKSKQEKKKKEEKKKIIIIKSCLAKKHFFSKTDYDHWNFFAKKC